MSKKKRKKMQFDPVRDKYMMTVWEYSGQELYFRTFSGLRSAIRLMLALKTTDFEVFRRHKHGWISFSSKVEV